MILLAIDTSTDYLSLAILKGRKIPAAYHSKADRRHSILLVPTIGKLLKKTGTRLKDVDCFVISIGPGSFTGLRIGVTVIKALAYTLGKPVVTVPTLDIIARNAIGFKGIICPVLDARKDKVYASLYRSDSEDIKRISDYKLLPMESLLKILRQAQGPHREHGRKMNKAQRYDKILLMGDQSAVAAKRSLDNGLRGVSIFKRWHPRAEVAVRIGAEIFKKKKYIKPEKVEPLYLYSRECDIKGY